MNTTRSSAPGWLLIGLVILLVLLIVSSLWNLAATTDFGESDFMIYWSAAYLIRNGQNPYNLDLIKSVQQAQPHSKPEPTTIAWNPPFFFVLLLPLAWMPFGFAKFAWLVISIVIVLTGALMLVSVYMPGDSPRVKLIFILFAIAFPAVVTGLYMGQVTFLVFWGLVACLFLMKKEQWFWAGAALILTTIKPHIVVLPVLYTLIYMAGRRKYQGWIGLAVAGFVCLGILLILSPALIHNLIGETSVGTGRWATSTIGGLLSYWGVTEATRYLILLFLPLPFIFLRYPEKFNLELSIALLTLITVPTTIYGWSYDQTILLIPIAQVFSWLTRSKYKWAIIACIVVGITLNYYQRVLPFNEVYYVWVPLFWLLVFGVTWRSVLRLNQSPARQS